MDLLTPAQEEIARDAHRFRVVNAGRRFGKDVLGQEEAIGVAVSRHDHPVAYIGPTYQQVRDIVWDPLKRRLRPLATATNEQRLEIRVRTKDGGESKIVLRGWESIETLRGQKFKFIVLTEVAMFKGFWVGWHEVLRPTLTDLQGGALFLSTPKGFNHWYDLYNLERTEAAFKSFHFTTYDNPHIPREELDEARGQLTEDRFAQEYLADFRKQEGLVYKEFDRGRHLFDDAATYRAVEKIAGVDFGHTNPACVLTIERDFDSNFWVRREWYKTKKTEDEIAEYVASQQFNTVYPDPENASAVAVLEKKGAPVREVTKEKGSVAVGINVVRELFKQNRLRIHRDCVNLISELETYHYPDKKEGRNEDEQPVKEHDHAVDALRYALKMVAMRSSARIDGANVDQAHHSAKSTVTSDLPGMVF